MFGFAIVLLLSLFFFFEFLSLEGKNCLNGVSSFIFFKEDGKRRAVLLLQMQYSVCLFFVYSFLVWLCLRVLFLHFFLLFLFAHVLIRRMCFFEC